MSIDDLNRLDYSTENGVLSLDTMDFVKNQENEKRLVAGTMDCQPDVVLISDDMGSQRWTSGDKAFREALMPGESVKDAIYRLGSKIYLAHKQHFSDADLDKLLVFVGDYNVGDNDWSPEGDIL